MYWGCYFGGKILCCFLSAFWAILPGCQSSWKAWMFSQGSQPHTLQYFCPNLWILWLCLRAQSWVSAWSLQNSSEWKPGGQVRQWRARKPEWNSVLVYWQVRVELKAQEEIVVALESSRWHTYFSVPWFVCSSPTPFWSICLILFFFVHKGKPTGCMIKGEVA